MIYHQSRKVEEIALNSQGKSTESNYPNRSSEKTGDGEGYFFSDFKPGITDFQPKRKSAYQQKQSMDPRVPFIQPLPNKGN